MDAKGSFVVFRSDYQDLTIEEMQTLHKFFSLNCTDSGEELPEERKEKILTPEYWKTFVDADKKGIIM